MKRIPLFLLISCLLAIMAYENNFPLLFSCVLFIMSFLFLKWDSWKVIGIVCMLSFILVFLQMNRVASTTSSLLEDEKGFVYSGRIISFPIYKEDKVQFILQTSGDKVEKVQCFITKNTHDLSYGDVITFSGKVKEPKGKRNPGGFDYKQYLRGKNIHALIYIEDHSVRLTNQPELNPFEELVLDFRKSFVDYIEDHFTKEEKDFLNGLILGEKAIDPQTIDDFNKLGVSHILSVSGLHVGYIYLFVSTICAFLKVNKKLQLLLVSTLLTIYCFMVGFCEPAVRASLMFVFFLLAEVLHKKYDPLNVVSLLAAIFLLYNPFIIFNVGFQLSYSAVICITVFYPYLNNKFKCKSKVAEYVKSLLFLTLSVQLGTIPFILFHFYNLSIISLMANLLIVPLSGFIMIGFLIAFFLRFLAPLAYVIIISIKWGIGFIFVISNALLRVPYAFLSLSPMPLLIVTFYYMALFLSFGYFYDYKKENRNKIALVSALNLCLLLGTLFWPKPLVVTFLDVGQGDSTLIEFPTGENILIDGGGKADYSIGDHIIAKALLAKNIRKLDLIISTHSHEDHLLGIMEILDDVNVKGIVINSLEEEGYEKLIIEANAYKIPVYENHEITLSMEDIHMDMIYPTTETPYHSANNSSIITKLVYKDLSFLFMGDLEEEGESMLMDTVKNLESDFIKIGHHGSKTSTNKEFLAEVNPRYGIISVGEDNFYNHPNKEVLDLLKSTGVIYFRTDEVGAIEIRTNGEDMHITTYDERSSK